MSIPKSIKLNELNPGVKARVTMISGGREVRQKLVNLGIVGGEEIQVLNEASLGPIVVKVQGVRIAVGRGLAGKVSVAILED